MQFPEACWFLLSSVHFASLVEYTRKHFCKANGKFRIYMGLFNHLMTIEIDRLL